MWGLFISQGCLVYSLYLYLSWLPTQDSPHFSSAQPLRRFAPIPYQIGEFLG
jgi:hypothetical protein